jgi:hypothetical protein
MLIYNVTIKVDHSIARDWLNWLQAEHIPQVIATGCFSHAVILRLRENENTDGVTYAIQYYTESEALYNEYIEKYAEELRKKGSDKWGNKYIAFRSVLEVVN